MEGFSFEFDATDYVNAYKKGCEKGLELAFLMLNEDWTDLDQTLEQTGIDGKAED